MIAYQVSSPVEVVARAVLDTAIYDIKNARLPKLVEADMRRFGNVSNDWNGPRQFQEIANAIQVIADDECLNVTITVSWYEGVYRWRFDPRATF